MKKLKRKSESKKPDRQIPQRFLPQIISHWKEMGLSPDVYLNTEDDWYCVNADDMPDFIDEPAIGEDAEEHRAWCQCKWGYFWEFHKKNIWYNVLPHVSDFINKKEMRFMNLDELEPIVTSYLIKEVPYDMCKSFKHTKWWKPGIVLYYDWSPNTVQVITELFHYSLAWRVVNCARVFDDYLKGYPDHATFTLQDTLEVYSKNEELIFDYELETEKPLPYNDNFPPPVYRNKPKNWSVRYYQIDENNLIIKKAGEKEVCEDFFKARFYY